MLTFVFIIVVIAQLVVITVSIVIYNVVTDFVAIINIIIIVTDIAITIVTHNIKYTFMALETADVYMHGVRCLRP